MSVPQEQSVHYRPCMLIAYADAEYSAKAEPALRRLGWDVYVSGTGASARRLTRMLHPEVVVLSTQLPDESGWLTCDKLMRDYPLLKVVLVSPEASVEGESFATFVGAAAYVSEADGVEALTHAACDEPVEAAV